MRLLIALTLLFAWSAAPLAAEGEFAVRDARVVASGEKYLLDADLAYRLSPPVVEALESGVPLTIRLEVEVLRERTLPWPERVAALSLAYRIAFHPLTEQYLVTHRASGAQRAYSSRYQALASLGAVRGLPLMGHATLIEGERYRARLRAVLDLEELPTPLRLVAYFSPAWGLKSEWYQWPLNF
ncbi:DUF4390 domain-containing protein [Endothiovibrio diazotrophicus]